MMMCLGIGLFNPVTCVRAFVFGAQPVTQVCKCSGRGG